MDKAEKKRWKSSFATFQFAAIKHRKKTLFLQKCSRSVRLLFGKTVLFSKRSRRNLQQESKKTRKRSRKKRWKSSFATFQFSAIIQTKKSLFLQKCSRSVRLLFEKTVLFSKRSRRNLQQESKKTRRDPRKTNLLIWKL
ncbi:hypothetical protein DTW91_10075 [Chryseobacterium sp. SC28]|nr:hypothetical protein DTW91_10075 [Chryseobacterium sp. SC28]